MLSLTYRSALGRRLTSNEVDGNFQAVQDAVNDLITNGATPVEISNITSDGATFTVWLADGSSFGPFTLPSASALVPVTTVSGSSYTLLLPDRGNYIRCTAAGGCAVEVPSEGETSIPVGAEYYFEQAGAGPVTFDAGTDVTLNVRAGKAASTAGQYAGAMLKKVAADEWTLLGDLEDQA
mgnify:FL=1